MCVLFSSAAWPGLPPTCVQWGGMQGGDRKPYPEQSPRHPPHAQEGARVVPQEFCCLCHHSLGFGREEDEEERKLLLLRGHGWRAASRVGAEQEANPLPAPEPVSSLGWGGIRRFTGLLWLWTARRGSRLQQKEILLRSCLLFRTDDVCVR